MADKKYYIEATYLLEVLKNANTAAVCRAVIRATPPADVAEIDAIEKALLDKCSINSYGGLTKADVKRELAKFRRKDK